MTAAEAREIRALRPRAGRWIRVEQARGSGHRCDGCGTLATRGFAFYETAVLSTAFICDPCAVAITKEES